MANNPAEVCRHVRALLGALGVPLDYTGQVTVTHEYQIHLHRGNVTRAYRLARPTEVAMLTNREARALGFSTNDEGKEGG